MKHPNLKIISSVLLFIIGLGLLVADQLSEPSFLGYSGLVVLFFFTLLFKDKIKILRILGNEIKFVKEAKKDIQEYLVDIFKIQLLAISASKPFGINVPKPIENSAEMLFETYDRLKKYSLLSDTKAELQKAAETALAHQLELLATYALQHPKYEGPESLAKCLAELEANKSFDWPPHYNVPEDQRESLYNETLKHLKTVEKILSEASASTKGATL